MIAGYFSRAITFLERLTKTDVRYITRNGFWLILGQGGAVLLSLGTAVAFGHFASQDTYGNYKYILSLAGLFSAFSLSGIGTAIIQATAKGFEGSLRQGVHLSLKWSWGILLISLAAAAYYFFIEHNAFLGVSLVIVGFVSPLLNSFSLFDSFLTGKKQFKRNALYAFLNALIPAVCVIGALFFFDRAIVVVGTYFISNALCDFIFYRIALRQEQNQTTDSHLLSYSKHLSVMGIVGAIGDKIDSIVLFSLIGPAGLAVYAFATAIPEQIKQIYKLALPLSAPRFAERSLRDIAQTIWRRVIFLALGAGAAVVAYEAVAPLLFTLLFPNYLDAVTYSLWYAPSIILSCASVPFLSILQAHKKTKSLYITTLASSLFLIFATPPLAYFFDISGIIVGQYLYRAFGLLLLIWQFIVSLHTDTGYGIK